MSRLMLYGLFAVLTIMAAPFSWAAPINVSGTGPLGSFTGTLDYTPATAVLDVTLTNTCASGFLTAIALNNPGSLTSILLAQPPTPSGFNPLGLSSNGVNASPLGGFDFGAGTGTSGWQGGGPPSNGLGAGDTATFRFNLAGTNLTALDTNSFTNAFSNGAATPGNHFLAVRFRGFEDGGSDKVSAVPLPAAVWLFGSGVIGLAALVRRRTMV